MMHDQIADFIDGLLNNTQKNGSCWKGLINYMNGNKHFADLDDLIQAKKESKDIKVHINDSYFFFSGDGAVILFSSESPYEKDGVVFESLELYIKIKDIIPINLIGTSPNNDKIKKLHHEIRESISSRIEMPGDMYRFMTSALKDMLNTPSLE